METRQINFALANEQFEEMWKLFGVEKFCINIVPKTQKITPEYIQIHDEGVCISHDGISPLGSYKASEDGTCRNPESNVRAAV